MSRVRKNALCIKQRCPAFSRPRKSKTDAPGRARKPCEQCRFIQPLDIQHASCAKVAEAAPASKELAYGAAAERNQVIQIRVFLEQRLPALINHPANVG